MEQFEMLEEKDLSFLNQNGLNYINLILKKYKPQAPFISKLKGASPALINLIHCMLQFNPNNRASIE